ncbi:pectin acetylesterase 5-like [Senna tora]|uniref:Pectin acetylesterase n=1 Tax=Senna tora TaxID=362788 RepID=A0A834TX40_9FABA|nr:pectin acetylesterase 5-like [Senna tora]
MPFSFSSSSLTNPSLRNLVWCRNWAKKDWAIAAFGFTLIVFAFALLSDSPRAAVQKLPKLNQQAPLVKLTLLRNAKDRGALCLDGSVPGYHFQEGFGSGSEKWLLHIEGGGWCDSISSCTRRKYTRIGSSIYMEKEIPFPGILSSDPLQNPDFFNWNKVNIRYCDGASLAGHPENDIKEGSRLFFRGQLIWEALMDELLSIGMSRAKQALLSGCSAGGLATLIHCDEFRELFPEDANVKCLSDAGGAVSFSLSCTLFISNALLIKLAEYVSIYQVLQKVCTRIVLLKWNRTRQLSNDLLYSIPSTYDLQLQCFFPEEIVKNIKTPVFLVNPAYDYWQIQHVLVPEGSDPHDHWKSCRLSISNCNNDQLDVLQGFRSSMLKAMNSFQQQKGHGMFINSCFIHCQTVQEETWHSANSPKINNKTIAESVGDWYFNRSEDVKQIDCPYPCNPTCYNKDFTRP